MKSYYVYILASKKNGTLYIGVTSNLIKRVYEHKNGLTDGFTKKYKVSKLVYFESFGTANEAIIREKQIKDMNREDKVELIKTKNPTFRDLYKEIIK